MPHVATLRLAIAIAALAGLAACRQFDFSDKTPRNYVMRNIRKGEQVACAWPQGGGKSPLPYADDPALPRDCIALCMRAGFHGDDKELESFAGYQSPIPDRKTQISMNIPLECQM